MKLFSFVLRECEPRTWEKVFNVQSPVCTRTSDERNCKISPFKFYITHKMADNIILYYFIQYFWGGRWMETRNSSCFKIKEEVKRSKKLYVNAECFRGASFNSRQEKSFIRHYFAMKSTVLGRGGGLRGKGEDEFRQRTKSSIAKHFVFILLILL